MSKDTFLSGLLIGAAAGAVAGILFAPDKGTETRKKISQKADELKKNILDQVDAVTGKLLNTGGLLKGQYDENNILTDRADQKFVSTAHESTDKIQSF